MELQEFQEVIVKNTKTGELTSSTITNIVPKLNLIYLDGFDFHFDADTKQGAEYVILPITEFEGLLMQLKDILVDLEESSSIDAPTLRKVIKLFGQEPII